MRTEEALCKHSDILHKDLNSRFWYRRDPEAIPPHCHRPHHKDTEAQLGTQSHSLKIFIDHELPLGSSVHAPSWLWSHPIILGCPQRYLSLGFSFSNEKIGAQAVQVTSRHTVRRWGCRTESPEASVNSVSFWIVLFPKKRHVIFVCTLSFIYFLSRLLTVKAFRIPLELFFLASQNQTCEYHLCPLLENIHGIWPFPCQGSRKWTSCLERDPWKGSRILTFTSIPLWV